MFTSPKKGQPANNSTSENINNNNNNNNQGNHTQTKENLVINEVKGKKINFPLISKTNQGTYQFDQWRMKERMKTVSVALVYCLNIGVDPPDVTKTEPCSRLECWIDPFSMIPPKALDAIGKQLQTQYERWQPRARYKPLLDPTADEVRKLCTSLRRSAKDERILFHYNGHGVPKPTNCGEIWVFNKSYTQYIPLSLYELQNWLGSPAIYVFDCSTAGVIVQWFEQREKELRETQDPSMKDVIILAACSSEILPMNPTLPADIFTSCLTTPIRMALKWFCLTEPLSEGVAKYIDRIPGTLTDRRTALGELNWIFTAITDTIAWNEFPRELFHKLFRQDLLVASLFRNYLLAERILYSLNCTPLTVPKLPVPTYQHHMWQAWDLAVDNCLSQMPTVLNDSSAEYLHSTFFTDQLTAFEVWLKFGSEKKKEPEQLPIVLQVLLSQVHRIRALELLAKFLDLGPWAVNLALSVGIFPYVLKLLQSPAQDLRQVLVFIWTKTLALDQSCQNDLVKDQGHIYFLNIYRAQSSSVELKTQCAFILSVICSKQFRAGQIACLGANLVSVCLAHFQHRDPLLRKWSVLCLSKIWEGYEDAKTAAIQESAHEKLCTLLTDPFPEVRAAAIYALSTLLGGAISEERVTIELNLSLTLLVGIEDASPICRSEFIITLARLVLLYKKDFLEIVTTMDRKGKSSQVQNMIPTENVLNQRSSVVICLWRVILSLRHDCHPEVAQYAEQIISFVQSQLPQPINITGSIDRKARDNNNNNNNLTPVSLGSGSSGSPQTVGSSPSVEKRKNSPFFGLGTGSLRSKRDPSPENSLKSSKESISLLTSLKKDQGVYDFSTLNLEEEEDPIIESEFFDYSCKYWTKATHNLVDETDHWAERKWREQRYEESISAVKRSQSISTEQPNLKWDEQAAILNNSPSVPAHILLHPFEPTVIVANHQQANNKLSNTISVWDRSQETRLTDFANMVSTDSNSIIGHTTGMTLLNEEDRSLLVTANDHAVVRIWSHYDDADQRKLASSFKAFVQGLVSGGKGAGLVINSLKTRGLLATSGDINVVRLWDLEKELHVQDISTGSDSSVTCIASDPLGNLITIGCADGSVRCFDHRTPPKFSHVATLAEHHGWLVNVQIPKSTERDIWSASASGEIKLWDIRKSVSVKTFQSVESLTSFTVHDYAGVFAVGSQKQKIKVFNFHGDDTLIRYHEGFLGQRIGPVTCLKFHPYLDLLAAGASDFLISIYTKRVH